MPKVTVTNFRGTTPRVSSRLLDISQAQTAENTDVSEFRLKALCQPSVITALAVGSDICQYGAYASGTGMWAVYGNNVISNDGSALKVQYVDSTSGEGAYTYLSNAGELTSDLTVGRTYKVTAKLKVSAFSSVLFSFWNGSVWATLATIAVTDFATVTGYFVATHATTNALGVVGMSGSEAVWIDDLTVAECVNNTRTLWKCGANYIAPGTVSADCSVVDSSIQESLNRFMFTGDSYPKQSDSTHWAASRSTHRLGVTPPAVAPTVSMSGTPDVSVQQYVSYYFTMVNGWGEESEPSPATAIITVMDGEHVDLSVLTAPSDAGADFVYKRIYRLNSGKAGGEYQFLAEIATAVTIYEDKGTGATLGSVSTDVCETEDWSIPPDGLAGLTQGPNGMMLGYYGKEVYVSEPGAPYAWPTAYKIQLDSDVTGLRATKDFILAISSRYPYIITGSSPEALIKTPVNQVMQCTSNRGMVATKDGIYFPTKEGLVFCNGTTVDCISEKIITKEQWAAMVTGTLISSWHEEKYIGFFKDTGSGLCYDPAAQEICTITLTTYADKIRDVYADASTGLLVLLAEIDVEPCIYSFDSSASYLTYTWKSKRFVDNDRYSVAKVKGDFTGGKTLTFAWYLNGTAKTFGSGFEYKTVTSETAFRLPSDSGAQDKEIQLSGTVFVDSIQFATSPEELT